MINVLVIDDSALVREVMRNILAEDNTIHLVEAVANPYKAVKILKNHKIDVITLDLEMPEMDGLTFLEKLMNQFPIPVVVISKIAEEGSDIALKALQLGAIDVINKPKLGPKNFFIQEKGLIIDAIKLAAKVNVKPSRLINKDYFEKKVILPDQANKKIITSYRSNKLILIGSSTGGTVVLRYILSQLPKTCNCILISQHMPENFTAKFSKSLDDISEMKVVEAAEDEEIVPGKVIIAKGDYHLMLKEIESKLKIHISQAERVNNHRPSVDTMFESAVKIPGLYLMGILLTGMGKDGAFGMQTIKKKGGITIIQNPESCVIYGMPKAAYDLGIVDYVLSPDEIIKKIIEFI